MSTRTSTERSQVASLAERAIALTVLALLLSAGAFAQRRSARSARAAKPSAAPAFEFTPDVEQLPPKYYGNNVNYYIANWSKAYRLKGEFESTSEYLAALDKNVPTGSIAFALPRGNRDASAIRYDADSGTLTATVQPLRYLDGYGYQALAHEQSVRFSGRGIVLNGKLGKQSYSTGRSFFGRRVRIRQDIYWNYGIAFASHGGPFPEHEMTISLPMNREDAERTKPNLGVLLVCHVDRSQLPDAIAFGESDHDEATVDSPIDEWTFTYWLAVKLDEVWLYDVTSGEILLRAPAASGVEKPVTIRAADPPLDGQKGHAASPSGPSTMTTSGADAGRLLARARELVGEGKNAEALAEIDTVIAKHRDLAPAYTLRALAFEQLGRIAEAVEAVQTSIALDPTSLTSYLVDARLALVQKDCAAARRSLDKAVGLDPAAPSLAPLRELYDAQCAGTSTNP